VGTGLCALSRRHCLIHHLPGVDGRLAAGHHGIGANRTGANDGTIHAIDLDCNTSPDARLTIPDSRTQPAELAVDADQDTVPESIYLDNDRDGQFDEARFDTNADGRPDLVGTELDSRLVPRRTRALPR
jgi:hypothetical protein